MGGRKELHLLLRGVEELRVPGKAGERFDLYCIASIGHQHHRTRLIEDTSSPCWNEEFVFDGSLVARDDVVRFELYSQGLFQDELLLYAYLQLDACASLEEEQEQEEDGDGDDGGEARGGARAPGHSRGGSGGSWQPGAALGNGRAGWSVTEEEVGTIAEEEGEEEEGGDAAPRHHGDDDAASLAAAAAASRRRLGSGLSGLRSRASAAASGKLGGGSSSSRAERGSASAAAKAAAAAASSGSSACVGRVSEVTTERLALLSAQAGSAGSSGGSSLLLPGGTSFGGLGGRGSSSARAAPAASLARMRLKRSSHVTCAADLVVSVWWVRPPELVHSDTPPCVLSFVHPPGRPHALPSATHTDIASMWEEPCLAFLRLVVASVQLGPAAAAAAAVAAGTAAAPGGAGAGSGGLEGGADGGSGGSKAVLQRMIGLVRGDPAARAEVAHAVESVQAAQAAAASAGSGGGDGHHRPTLADIHGAGGLAQSFREAELGLAGAAQWAWQAALDALEEDDEGDDAAASTRSSSAGAGGGGGGASQQQHHRHHARWGLAGRKQRHGKAGGGGADGGGGGGRRRDKRLHLTVRLRLGGPDGPVQALSPVPVGPDGSAAVAQAAVFAVLRPLEEAEISYELSLGRGPSGPPLLTLIFQYSLLHLLRRSPVQPVAWEDWRAVARATVPGLKVPLPVLPMAYLDLSAFLADADCRAGMYQVPPVSGPALAKAAADDAAAAAAAAADAEEAAAVAAEAAAEEASEASLTDTEDEEEEEGAAGYDYIPACDQGAAGPVLRRRAGAAAGADRQHDAALHGHAHEQQQQQQQRPGGRTGKGSKQHANLDKWRTRVLAGVEAGLTTAMDKLPDGVAQQVKGRLFDRLFPHKRAEVFTIGQLRVPSRAPQRADTAPSASAARHQAKQQQKRQAGSDHASTGGTTPTAAAAACQRKQSMTRSVSAGLLSAKLSTEQAVAAAAAAAAAAAEAANVVPLQDHPNVATSGAPGRGLMGVLQLQLRGINLRKGSLSAGYSLLLKSGPHWLELSPAALPLSIYASANGLSGSSGGGGGEAGGAMGGTNQVPPVQVLLPVYGNSCLVALVLHRRASVVGRCVFRLYGLLPLLLRDYDKTLTLYSDKREAGGGRIVAGSVTLHLAAAPPPGYGRLRTYARLAMSYLVTPHTLSLHTSGVLASMGRDERAAAAGQVVLQWLGQQGQAAVPDALVGQLVATGRTAMSTRSMMGHVRRIKAVLLDWLPRRLDPLAFYYWRRPSHNLLALWVLSHACLYPGHWLLSVALLLTCTLLRRMAIQIRKGLLGFEVDQVLPQELVADASLAPRTDSFDDLSECDSLVAGSHHGGEEGSGGGGLAHHLRSSAGQLGDRQLYKEAADRFRERLEVTRTKINTSLAHQQQQQQAAAATAPPPRSLEELREQLEAGTLSLEALDIEAAAAQLLSVGGLLRLARAHSSYVWAYALVAQNLLDDAAGFAEGLYAMATAQDPLAALLLCAIATSAAAFCHWAGLGAGVFVLVAVLLRPPLLRGVPGVFGWKALLAHLRGHGRSLEELAW